MLSEVKTHFTHLRPGTKLKVIKYRWGLHFDVTENSVSDEKFTSNKYKKANKELNSKIELTDREVLKLLDAKRIIFGLVLESKSNGSTSILFDEEIDDTIKRKTLLRISRKAGEVGRKLIQDYNQSVKKVLLERAEKERLRLEKELKIKERNERLEQERIEQELLSFSLSMPIHPPHSTNHSHDKNCWNCKVVPLSAIINNPRCEKCGGLMCNCKACHQDCEENLKRGIQLKYSYRKL